MYSPARVSHVLSESVHKGCMGEFKHHPLVQSAQADGREIAGCRWVMGAFHTMLSTGRVCFIQAQGSPA